jgi:hypothetical protein
MSAQERLYSGGRNKGKALGIMKPGRIGEKQKCRKQR